MNILQRISTKAPEIITKELEATQSSIKLFNEQLTSLENAWDDFCIKLTGKYPEHTIQISDYMTDKQSLLDVLLKDLVMKIGPNIRTLLAQLEEEQRAAEHLESVGIDVPKLKKFLIGRYKKETKCK